MIDVSKGKKYNHALLPIVNRGANFARCWILNQMDFYEVEVLTRNLFNKRSKTKWSKSMFKGNINSDYKWIIFDVVHSNS